MTPQPPYTARELPAAEWERLAGVGFYATQPLPNPQTTRIVVVEDATGHLLGYWGCFALIHVEPLYLTPEARTLPGVGRRLWAGVRDLLRRLGVPAALAVVDYADGPTNLPMAFKLGFRLMPGTLLMWEAKETDHG